MRNAHLILLTALALLTITATGLLASSAWGYRPFVSTDAAVAERARMEIELGHFTLARMQGENAFLTPQIVVNYGFAQHLELVGEASVEKPPDADLQLVDPGLFLKAVVKEGILQEKGGVSIAVEMGPLLPSTRLGERRLGFEGIGTVSHRVSPFTFHLNVGGGVAREGTRLFAVWGLITEFPVVPQARLVGEVNGESVHGQAANNSALLGVLWQSPLRDVVFDAGIRRGFSHGAPDWLFTTGLTVGFSLSSRERAASR